MVTGIAPSVWAAEGMRAMVTADHVLRGKREPDQVDDGEVMSG